MAFFRVGKGGITPSAITSERVGSMRNIPHSLDSGVYVISLAINGNIAAAQNNIIIENGQIVHFNTYVVSSQSAGTTVYATNVTYVVKANEGCSVYNTIATNSQSHIITKIA